MLPAKNNKFIEGEHPVVTASHLGALAGRTFFEAGEQRFVMHELNGFGRAFSVRRVTLRVSQDSPWKEKIWYRQKEAKTDDGELVGLIRKPKYYRRTYDVFFVQDVPVEFKAMCLFMVRVYDRRE